MRGCALGIAAALIAWLLAPSDHEYVQYNFWITQDRMLRYRYSNIEWLLYGVPGETVHFYGGLFSKEREQAALLILLLESGFSFHVARLLQLGGRRMLASVAGSMILWTANLLLVLAAVYAGSSPYYPPALELTVWILGDVLLMSAVWSVLLRSTGQVARSIVRRAILYGLTAPFLASGIVLIDAGTFSMLQWQGFAIIVWQMSMILALLRSRMTSPEE